MRSFVACWRVVRLIVHLLHGLGVVALRFPTLSPAQQQARVQAWSLALLRHAGIRLVVQGQPAVQGPVMLVANHISWLDIPVLHAARYCRFISKSDVQGWPLIGALATAAGTLYIERSSRRDAMRMVHAMRKALQEGEVLAVFPEGTTGDGTTLLPFHANLLQAAISADAPVQPVALQFMDGATGQISFAPCYVGDDTLLQSLWRTLCADNVQVVVQFGAQQRAAGRDRRTWAADLRRTIAALRGHA